MNRGALVPSRRQLEVENLFLRHQLNIALRLAEGGPGIDNVVALPPARAIRTSPANIKNAPGPGRPADRGSSSLIMFLLREGGRGVTGAWSAPSHANNALRR
jgi:hypothetical protein